MGDITFKEIISTQKKILKAEKAYSVILTNYIKALKILKEMEAKQWETQA